MLAKTIFAATFLALAQFTVATPPGCLLGAVNTYSDPANVQAVCKEKDISSKVATFCGDATQAALAALADICNEKGVKVATAVPSSSATASASKPSGTGSFVVYPTGSGSGSGSGSGNSTSPTATGGPRASGSASGSGRATGTSTGGLAESTGAAGKLEIGIAAIVAGLMAVAL